MSKKKKQKKAKNRRKAKLCKKLQVRNNRRIIKKRPALKAGMLVQFVGDPSNNIRPNEWVFSRGIRLWPGKYTAEELHPAFSSKFTEKRREIEYVKRQDLFDSVAMLIKTERTTYADLCQVLVDEQLWWVLRSDLKGQYHG